ncbi:hypothetical protein IGI04_042780 [Brassica rapa subsp. trilocularis]|uniref:Uncharacterized protein n=1 Tax=Brassica rapa subsp. trilocularis TaxID=1813537 RepID=A0ABQ7KJ21_BRACM|nr:hypothetical protein IGI04_042780 [Brassica rapa subsp. trilocularis]
MGLESCFRSLWAVFRLDTFTTSFPRFLIREIAFKGFDENARTGVVLTFGKVQSLHSDRILARARSLRSDRAGRALGRYRPSGTIAWSLRSDRALARARSLRSDRAGRSLGRYVATELWLELGRYVANERDERSRPSFGSSSVATQRPSGTIARSLRSDRAGRSLGRYVATELGSSSRPSLAELGRYVVTERDDRSRPGGTIARSLCSDRALARARSLRSDRAGRSLGRYVATELCACLVAAYRSSLACPRSDFHTRACPRPIWIHVRCLRTIDIFTKITFRKNGYADFYGLSDIDSVVTDFDPNRCLILCLEMLETSALGLGQDLGLLLVLEGAMTNSTYVSRFSFILIPYRFKVRDRFSAYTTCMVGIEHLSGDRKCWTKISDFFYSAIILVSDVRESSSTRWLNVSAYDCLVFHEGVFIEEGNFVEELIFRRPRRLAMLKICYSFVCHVSCLKCSRALKIFRDVARV